MPNRAQFGVMYHVLPDQRETWRRDFEALARGGFARVVLAEKQYNVDQAARALEVCGEYGLKGYFLPLNPVILSPEFRRWQERRKDFCNVGIDGQVLTQYVFNPFHPGYRKLVLVPFLQRIARTLKGQKALTGFFLDDTMDTESVISYTPHDARAFRAFLKVRYSSLDSINRSWGQQYRRWSEVRPPRIMLPWRRGWRKMWQDWCEARQAWWVGWAEDVSRALAEAPGAERVLGDDWYSVRFGYDATGGFTPAMVAPFDAFSFDYCMGTAYLDPKMTNIDRDVAMARDLAGTKRLTIFLVAASRSDKPFPEAPAIIARSERCLKNRVSGIDYYVYRAWPGNYAEKNCLANHPGVFRELSAFVRANS